MADIKVRFEVNPNKESEPKELLGNIVNDNAELSNVSLKTDTSNIFQNVPQKNSDGINGLSWGKTFINDKGQQDSYLVFDEQGYVDNEDLQGGVLESEQNPTEFIWGVVPESKQYSVKLTFSNASNLKDIIVYGNQTTNQFPTRAIIDGTTEIYSDDYRWAINLQTESDTHTIEFTHWNRANYNASLNFIAIMMRYFEIDKQKGLKSIESLSQITGQPKDIFYGVIPNSGSIEIIDIDGEIADMITDGVIPNSNLNLEIFANNKQVQNHSTNSSDYSRDKIFSVDMSNKLSNLENLTYDGFKNEDMTRTLYDILVDGLKTIGYTDSDYIDDVMLGEENTNYLKSITYPSPYMPVMNFKDFMDKLCEIAQLILTQNDNGDLIFVNLKPVNVINDCIVIPQRMQYSQPFKTIVLNNKIERVEYVNSNFRRDIDKTVNTYTNENTFIEPFTEDFVPITNRDYHYFRGQTLGQYLTQGVRVETFVTNGSFEIVDQSIQTISDFQFSVSGKKFNKPFYGYNVRNESFWSDPTYSLISDLKVTFNTYQDGSVVDFTEKLSEVSYSFRELQYSEDKTLKLSHNNSINFTKIEDGRWKVDYSILTSTAWYYWYGTDYEGPDEQNDERGEFKSVEKLTISANGNQWVLDFIDNVVKVGDTNSTLYKSLSRNELLQDNTTYNGTNIGTVIANNILKLYNKGLSTAEISVVCGDYYNEKGKLIKKWANGDILQIGDIVRIDKDNKGNPLWKYSNGLNMYFKITGRKFRYAGVPLLDLELQEVKVVN